MISCLSNPVELDWAQENSYFVVLLPSMAGSHAREHHGWRLPEDEALTGSDFRAITKARELAANLMGKIG